MACSVVVTGTAAGPMRAPFVVIDDFLPVELAEAMRGDIDAHFARPYAHHASTHQIWNYWFVPETYTYLRTRPEKVIQRERVNAFMQALGRWSLPFLGLGDVGQAYLSLYVSGCRQTWHNDAMNGRFAYVYSLTRNDRRTTGGETLIMPEGDLFRANLTRPVSGRYLYEAIEPRFNRLVVFDDRLAHAVERVEGSMDPVEGRFVLHGHLNEASAAVSGALPAEAVIRPMFGALQEFAGTAPAQLERYHGPLVLRITVSAAGAVTGCAVLLDRVIGPANAEAEREQLLATLIDRVGGIQFPPADGETTITQPVRFGALLRRNP